MNHHTETTMKTFLLLVFLSGCTDPLNQTPDAGHIPTPVIHAADTDFGLVTDGTVSSRYVNISNEGDAPLTVTGAHLGNNNLWFSFGQKGCEGSFVDCTFPEPMVITDVGRLLTVRCAPQLGDSGHQVAVVTFSSDSTGGKYSAAVACSAQP